MTLVRTGTQDGLLTAGNLAVSAAAAGILAGLSACQTSPSPPAEAVTIELPPAARPPPRASHAVRADMRVATAAVSVYRGCCSGRNECKGKGNCKVHGLHDCMGKNECKGKGGCRGPDCSNEVIWKSCCKGKNECKGLGGCKAPGNACKGMNSCKGLGGCAAGTCPP